MNGIGRLPSQILAAMDAAELAAGAKPGGASGARFSESPPADFGGHLADLAQRDAQSNGLNGNARDSGGATPAPVGLDFDPAAKPAKTTSFGAVTLIQDPRDAKPLGVMAPNADIIEREPGAGVVATQVDRSFAGSLPLEFLTSDNCRVKPGIELGARAPEPSAHGLPAGFADLAGESQGPGRSVADTCPNGAGPATAPPHKAAQASRGSEAPSRGPPQIGIGGLPPLSANDASLMAAMPLSGAFSHSAQPVMAAAAATEDGRQGTLASNLPSLDGNRSFNRFGMQTLGLKKSVSAGANWDRGLDAAFRAPVSVIAAAQESHLALTKQLSPGGQSMTLNQLSAQAGEVGTGVVSGVHLPQTANLDRYAASPQADGFANIPLEPAGNHDSLAVPVRASSSASSEFGDVVSAAVPSLGGTAPASTEHSSLPAGGPPIPNTISPPVNGLNAADSQFAGNEGARVPPPATETHGAGGISPTRLAPSAVPDEVRPDSANLLPPAMQIANFMLAPVEFGGSVPARGGAQPEAATQKAAGPVSSASLVQILHLQLEPENLGKVNVKMRLAGPNLQLQVEAERPETARLIGNDTETLSGKLRSAGYEVDTLAIRTADSQAPQPALTAGAEPKQDQYAGHANGGPADHDRPSMREENSPSKPIPEDDAKGAHCIRSVDGELYL